HYTCYIPMLYSRTLPTHCFTLFPYTTLFRSLPLEKVVRNIIRARFLRPGVRPYRTENIYAPFTHRGAVGKEDAIAKSRKSKARRSEEHTSELQSRFDLVCRLLLEKKD